MSINQNVQQSNTGPGRSVLVYASETGKTGAELPVSRIRELGFTTIFVVAKDYDGSCHFKRANHTGSRRLENAIAAAQTAGLATAAWVCAFCEGYRGRLGGRGNQGLLSTRPDLSCVDKTGRNTIVHPLRCDYGREQYACPSSDDVVEELETKLADLGQTPGIETILLDFMRFPLQDEYCYCLSCQAKFIGVTGHELLGASPTERLLFKEGVLRQAVERLVNAVKAKNAGMRVGALVWPRQKAAQLGQRWWTWPIDYAAPMFYHASPTGVREEVARFFDEHLQSAEQPLVPMVGGPLASLVRATEWNDVFASVAARAGGNCCVGHYGLGDVLSAIRGKSVTVRVKQELARTALSARQSVARQVRRHFRKQG